MAGGGEEARLADIGLFRRGARFRKLGVDPRQLGGALDDALLQRFIGLFQRLIGGHALGDVGIGGDDALVGHGVGAHLDDARTTRQRQQEGLVEGQEGRDDRLFAAGAISPRRASMATISASGKPTCPAASGRSSSWRKRRFR